MFCHDCSRVLRNGGGIGFSYADEVSAETVNTSSENAGFFSKAVISAANLFTSFFTWSVNKYGDVKGRILAWGLPGVILLWVAGTVFRMLFKKFVGNPAKKKVNKFSREQFGTSVFNRKRTLTKREIISITKRYGFVEDDNKTYNGFEVYTSWIYPGFTFFSVYFCSNGIFTEKGIWNQKNAFLSYEDLRNDEDITMQYLRRKFVDFPDDFYNTLMELREA